MSVSATVTYEEEHSLPPDSDRASRVGDKSQEQQDRWLCERLRELYASGSFWHVSAKLAADRIECLIAERDCALAAFDLELGHSVRGPAPAEGVVDCERQTDGTFAPTRIGSPELQPAPVQPSLPPPALAVPGVERTPESQAEITDEEVEAAARILCAHAGVDPEEPVLYRDHKGIRVRRAPDDEDAARCSTMPVWKWRFENQARAALEAAASARPRPRAAHAPRAERADPAPNPADAGPNSGR